MHMDLLAANTSTRCESDGREGVMFFVRRRNVGNASTVAGIQEQKNTSHYLHTTEAESVSLP
jgi:hypothetical protein